MEEGCLHLNPFLAQTGKPEVVGIYLESGRWGYVGIQACEIIPKMLGKVEK